MLSLAALPADAQNLINENTSIYSNLCVGPGCDVTETYAEPVQESVIRIDNNRVRLEFVDASNPAGNFPTNDWSIFTNDFEENGASYFAIQDDETGRVPFRIEAAAPTNALYVGATGEVGIGTAQPQAPLHIFRNDSTQEMIFLDSNRRGGPQDRAMIFLANNGGIRFEFANNSLSTSWRFQAATGNQDRFEVTKVGTGDIELAVDATGNLEILGTLMEMSDRESKQDIKSLAGDVVLERLSEVSISEWSYRRSPDTRHVGPMAQDFYAAFGLGKDDKHISARDMAGVSMAAVKALEARNRELQERVEQLEALVMSMLPQTAQN
jgi:hypothetical protein